MGCKVIWMYINHTRGDCLKAKICWDNGGVQVYKVLH